MKVWSIVLFFVCLNLACALVSGLISAGVLGDAGSDFLAPYSLDNIISQFSFSTILGVGAGAIVGLIGIMLKQYTFGVLAGAIWIVGSLTTIGTWVLSGLNVFLGLILAGTGLEFIAPIVYVGVLVMFFGLILEQLGNKPLT